MKALPIPAALPSLVQPPTLTFPPAGAPTPGPLQALPCPNCAGAGPKALVLRVDVQLPGNPGRTLHVLRCPDCTARFYDNQAMPDYAEPTLNDRGRVPFYVQQGAGLSLITRPLAQLQRPPGAAYMEVGCGYGFGLDYALNTRGWRGIGIDPAPLAALGRDALGLPIELRYLRDDDEAHGTIDIALGSEVIEHVPSPIVFVRTLRAMLKPGGVMVLTTPNGDDIGPTTPPGIIIPLLSPTLHLVIQTRESLRALLLQAGFARVVVEVDSHSLVAFASDAPLDLEHRPAALRQALRTHLERRASQVDPASDLFLGLAGRAFCESVNDGDLGAADRAWALLRPACQARFGLDLESLPALPPGLATCELEDMARLVPLNLAGLLYGRAIRLLHGGTPRPALTTSFMLAARAAAALRRALQELAMEDGQTEEIGWTAEAEALLCRADAGDDDVAARWMTLPPAPNGGEARRRAIALRAFAHLVNAGRYPAAAAFAGSVGLDRLLAPKPGQALSAEERDALFCMGVMDVQPQGQPRRALGRFALVRTATAAGSDLWFAALRGELQGLDMLNEPAQARQLAGDLVRLRPNVTFPPDILARLG